MSDNAKNDNLGRRLKTISGDIKLYIEKRVELLLLDVGEHFSRLMAESLQKMTGIVLLSGALIFLLVALAHYLGELFNSESLGYILVSTPLLVIGMLFLYLKPKSMLERIQNHFQKEIVRALSANGEELKHDLNPAEKEHGEESNTH